jgi:hypothetical protein
MQQVQFKQWNCEVRFAQYSNGRTALRLMDEEGPVAVATINLPLYSYL